MDIKKFHMAVFGVISLSVLVLEIRYAFHAWFLQDDFNLMWVYHNAIVWKDIIPHATDFGRFLTRDLYWYAMYASFGKNAIPYFCVNLAFIVSNTVLLFYFLNKSFNNIYLSSAAAISYFVSLPMLQNYGWISNSQHIIAHTFILLFFMAGFSERRRFLTIPLYLAGVYANTLVLFALPPLLLYWFFTKNFPKVMAVMLAIIAIVFLAWSKSLAVGPYQMDWTGSTAWKNAHYYYTSGLRWFILPLWGAAFYKAYKNKDVFLAFIVTAAISFYLPFAFLKYQHAINYFALTYLFNLTIIFYLIKPWPWVIFVIFLALSARSFVKLHEMIVKPVGENARIFVTAMQPLQKRHGQTICFRSVKITKNTTGVAVWDVPSFWWTVGFGDAFKLFITRDNQYVLFSPHEKCTKVITWDEKKLQVVK